MKKDDFLTWKIITLGFYTVDRFRKFFNNGNGFRIYCRANDLINQPSFAVSPREVGVELVRLSVGALGFKGEETRRNIYKRAFDELGCKPCPNEIGIALRSQYVNQPMSEQILVGMDPIIASDGFPKLFKVGRHSNGIFFLGVHDGDPGRLFPVESQWIFLRNSQWAFLRD